MTVTCPTCQLKGVMDPGHMAAPSSVVCARCETVYEVSAAQGQSPSATPGVEVSAAAILQPESNAAPSTSGSDDVLAIPQQTFGEDVRAGEENFVLEDVFAEAMTEVSNAEAEATAPAQPVSNGDGRLPGEPARSEDKPAPAPAKKKAAASSHGSYALGARLFRAAPAWLLLTGATFVAVLFLLNWSARPSDDSGIPTATVAAQPGAQRNDATSRPATAPQARPVEASVPAQQAEQQPAPLAEPSAAQTPESSLVEAVKVQKKQADAPVADGAGGRFTVQVGAYNVNSQADERAAALREAGFEAGVVSVELPGRGTWYRVQAGRFATREEAARHGAQLRAKGVAQSVLVSEIQN